MKPFIVRLQAPDFRLQAGTIRVMEGSPNPRLQKVLDQLRLYEHPLLTFDAREQGDHVEVIINFRNPAVPVHTYYFSMHPRDLDHPQFEWTFQHQLFACVHDYLIEMFVRTPQTQTADARARAAEEDIGS